MFLFPTGARLAAIVAVRGIAEYHSYKHDKHEEGGELVYQIQPPPSITFDSLVTGMVRGAGALLVGPAHG